MNITSLNCQRAYKCKELEDFLQDLVSSDQCDVDFILLQEVDESVLKIIQEVLEKNSNYKSTYPDSKKFDIHEGNNDSTVTRSLQVIYNSEYKLVGGRFFSSIFDKGCIQNFHGFTANIFKNKKDESILIVNIHLTAHPKNIVSRRKEARVLKKYLKIMNDRYDIDSTIAGGDFNTSRPREVSKIDEILSPYLNRIKYKGFSHQSKNLEPTKFIYKLIRAAGRVGISVNTQLDHFYVSPNLIDQKKSKFRFEVDPICVSDHHPIILEIN